MPNLNLYVHGEGGHPAWYSGWSRNSRLASGELLIGRTIQSRNKYGWQIRDMIAHDLKVMRDLGIRASVRPGRVRAICTCRQCRFLVTAVQARMIAHNEAHPDRAWRKLPPPR